MTNKPVKVKGHVLKRARVLATKSPDLAVLEFSWDGGSQFFILNRKSMLAVSDLLRSNSVTRNGITLS